MNCPEAYANLRTDSRGWRGVPSWLTPFPQKAEVQAGRLLQRAWRGYRKRKAWATVMQLAKEKRQRADAKSKRRKRGKSAAKVVNDSRSPMQRAMAKAGDDWHTMSRLQKKTAISIEATIEQVEQVKAVAEACRGEGAWPWGVQ